MRYTGGCQCGKVRFEADTEINEVISCNCSRCQKLGALLSAVPGDKFKLTAGKDVLKTFTFNKHVIRHMFCDECGIQPFAQGQLKGVDMTMVNVRCVDSVDPESFKVRKFDGRAL
jgi:hypothetical protein